MRYKRISFFINANQFFLITTLLFQQELSSCASIKVKNDLVETMVAIIKENPEFTLNQMKVKMQLWLPSGPAIGGTTLAKVLFWLRN